MDTNPIEKENSQENKFEFTITLQSEKDLLYLLKLCDNFSEQFKKEYAFFSKFINKVENNCLNFLKLSGDNPETKEIFEDFAMLKQKFTKITELYQKVSPQDWQVFNEFLKAVKPILKKIIQQRPKEKKLIIPKKEAQITRIALTPALPLLEVNKDGQFIFSSFYESPLFKIRVDVNKDLLKELNLTDEDLKLRDEQFMNTIRQWLLDKRAREETDEIRGNIKELARDILGNKTPRGEDYKKVKVNLGFLLLPQGFIYNKIEKSWDFINFIQRLHIDDKDNFIVWLTTPKVVEGAIEKTIETTKKLVEYITKTTKDIYPKQNRYEYWLRQYLAEIRNITKDIPQISGFSILEKAGYIADVILGRKKYRNTEAEKIVNKFIDLGNKEYGLIIGYHKDHEKIKDVRKRLLYIKASYKQDLKTLQAPDILRRSSFIEELAVWINQDPRYPDLEICKRKATGLVNRYGYLKVKEIYERHLKDENFNINLLEAILKKA